MGVTQSKAQRAQNKLLKVSLDLTIASKQLQKEAGKQAKSSELSKQKLKKAMEKGDMELAKIHAESSVRQTNTSRKYHLLAARIEAVRDKVKMSMATNNLNMNMTKVTQGLATVLSTMEPDAIAARLDKFEEQNEMIDVRTEFMEGAISNTVAGSTPQETVGTLMQQVGDEIGLDVSAAMAENELPTPIAVQQAKEQVAEKEKE
eukprot:snap_masked-scaffold_11-processed-gene-3.16-mRNA-1 protein AED:0.03 eAED:0.03 QI:0/-1/0/1/-1/1/1/0/203